MTVFFFFFNDTATTEIYTLSLHDALPISGLSVKTIRFYSDEGLVPEASRSPSGYRHYDGAALARSEEHTSELQSRQYLVCRLLLEKKQKKLMHILPRSQEHTSYTHSTQQI